MSENCGNCRFSRDKAGMLDCRHHPPSAFPIQNGDASGTAWPTVEASDWCGDYRPREEPPPTLSDFIDWVKGSGYRDWLFFRTNTDGDDPTSASQVETRRTARRSAMEALTEFLRQRGFPK